MTAKEKHEKLFGSLETLSDNQPWTTGLASLLEHFAWGTSYVLGISKTKLIKLVVEISDSDELSQLSTKDKLTEIDKKLKAMLKETDKTEKYDSNNSGYCSPREALRRNRYFSEDYLNAEFNIFLSLCSDKYINQLYNKYISCNTNGSWSTHGNTGVFEHSSGISKMQMDNLAYNGIENVLVANELKLGGKKNKDQILKYCFMYKELVNIGLIQDGCEFLLLFITDEEKEHDFNKELQAEIEYAKTEKKLTYLLDEDIFSIAHSLNIQSLPWSELIIFNKNYISEDNTICQVERKLLAGFNQTLKEKAFMQQ